jgi:hypothetical protein
VLGAGTVYNRQAAKWAVGVTARSDVDMIAGVGSRFSVSYCLLHLKLWLLPPGCAVVGLDGLPGMVASRSHIYVAHQLAQLLR